jgi:predicted ATP-dependent endonuclease of OLD family
MPAARVRLHQFRLLAYRSCRDTQLTVDHDVTAVIGPNGAGKTNLLHGLMLMSLATTRISPSRKEEFYTRECKVEATFTIRKKPVVFNSIITYRPTEQNRDELVDLTESWDFGSFNNNFTKVQTPILALSSKTVGNIPSLRRWYSQALMRLSDRDKIFRDANQKPLPREIIDAFDKIQEFRLGINYYSASQFTNPSLCPTSIEVDEKDELVDEFTYRRSPVHTRFIFELFILYKYNKDSYNQYVSLVNVDGVGLINTINWRSVAFSSQVYEVRSGGRVISKQRKRTMIIPTVEIGSSQLSFNQLSEGTLRTLAMLFYVITDKSRLLLLEEPEICVHHGLLNSVIQIIKEYGRTKQIIFSTHSETVVDGLTPEQVLIVNRHRSKGTIVSKISDKMSKGGFAALKSYLATSGNLGEYWRHSGFNK